MFATPSADGFSRSRRSGRRARAAPEAAGGAHICLPQPLTPTLPAATPGTAKRAAFSVARLTAEELPAFGITMNCAPVLDLPVEGAHEIIGDRAYGAGRRPGGGAAEAVALA